MSRKDENPESRDAPEPGRRQFLKAAGLAGVGAAAAGAAMQAGEAAESPPEQAKARYQQSAHVERFYSLNRL